ncbi:MAG: hypothetical protein V3R85_04180 [Alphaproteobacteria bacterium]
MISAREISQGIYGAWRLAAFDDNGIKYFDNTPEAALASFKAALLVLPVHIALILLQTDWSLVTASVVAASLIHIITFIVDWSAFPLAMYYVARLCDRSQWYWRYLAAYNWAQVLQITLFVVISGAMAAGLVPPPLGGLLIFAALIAVFIYKGFIARVAMETTMPTTVGIVMLDLGISALLSAITANMLRGNGLFS